MLNKLLKPLGLVLFVALCAGLAFSPLAGFLMIRQMPGVATWIDSPWLGGVYLSWALLVYFSWAFLPRTDERWQEWVLFLGLELVYPIAMWGISRSQWIVVDVLTYWSSCVAGGAGYLLVSKVLRGVRTEQPRDWVAMIPGLLLAIYGLVIPSLGIESAWWQLADLGGAGDWSSALRVAGISLGSAGVVRNLARME